MERLIEAEKIELVINLFGSFDENVRLIEKELDVAVRNRGSEIKVGGEPENVDKAISAINALLAMASRGEQIGEQEVRYVMSQVETGNEEQLEELLSTVYKLYDVNEDAEITVEINPATIDYGGLHKIKDGSIDKSYGIHVAKLSGMPSEVITRANEILNFYENKKVEPTNDKIQLSMDFEEVKKDSEIENKVKEIDPLNMTPIDAINFLYELKEISKKSV